MVSRQIVEERVSSVHGLAVTLALSAHKVPNSTYDLEDLIQAAILGATVAAHNYEEEHDSAASFSTYAIFRMRQEIRKLYYKSSVVHIPKRNYMAMKKEDRPKIMFNFVYLSAPVGDTSYRPQPFESQLAAPPEPDELFKTAAQNLLKHFLMRLSPRKRFLIRAVYGFLGEPMTIADASALCHVSKQRGWQLIQEALTKIERMCKAQGVTSDWASN